MVTYGRTGSTLLQGLLNAIPGYWIYGENGGFLLTLQESYAALPFAHRHMTDPTNDKATHAWFGSSRYDETSMTRKFGASSTKYCSRPSRTRPMLYLGSRKYDSTKSPMNS